MHLGSGFGASIGAPVTGCANCLDVLVECCRVETSAVIVVRLESLAQIAAEIADALDVAC
jgi:hypothetical protein